MTTSIKYFFLAILSLFLFSCDKQRDKELSYILLLSPESSTVIEKSLIRDSILIKTYFNDSILISKYSNGKPTETMFFNNNDSFWEKRYRSNDFGEILGFDSILTFSKRDTVFLYKSAREFIPIVQDYSFADCQYSIRKIGNEYKTTKQSLIDSTYKEIFFYNKDYKIYKFINTWKNNKCVYVRKD